MHYLRPYYWQGSWAEMTAISAVPDGTPSLWHSSHLWWSSAPWLGEAGSEEVGKQLSLETLET